MASFARRMRGEEEQEAMSIEDMDRAAQDLVNRNRARQNLMDARSASERLDKIEQGTIRKVGEVEYDTSTPLGRQQLAVAEWEQNRAAGVPGTSRYRPGMTAQERMLQDLKEQNERFDAYGKNAEKDRMERIARHREDYRPDERRAADEYFKRERGEEERMDAAMERQSRERIADMGMRAEIAKGDSALGIAGIRADATKTAAQIRAEQAERSEEHRDGRTAQMNRTKTEIAEGKNKNQMAVTERKEQGASERQQAELEAKREIEEKRLKNQEKIAQMRKEGMLTAEGIKARSSAYDTVLREKSGNTKKVSLEEMQQQMKELGFTAEEAAEEWFSRGRRKKPETQPKTAAVQRPGINRFMV